MRNLRHSIGLFSVIATLSSPALAVQPPPGEPPPPAPPEPQMASASASASAQVAPPDTSTPQGITTSPATTPPPPTPPGGLKIEGSNTSLKLGFLLQPGYEYDSGTATADTQSNAFFLRRARLMLGLTLGTQFELFAETDAPNLGKATGAAGNPGFAVQDAFGTWKPMDEIKLDAGLMLIPLSHNGLQGATTLYGWDYFAYSFQQSAGLTNYIGRDLGAQLRGLVAKHLEYRLAIYQGNRAVPPPPAMGQPPVEAPSRTTLRFSGRLQYNFLDAENAYFYAGTYGGAKRVFSVGAGIDHQSDYNAVAGDVFADLPMMGKDVLTGQVNVVHYDGGTWVPTLPQQTDIMAEVGYRLGSIQLSPILRFEDQIMDSPTPTAPNTLRFGGGLAWWIMSHNINVKLFYTYIKPDSDALRTVSQVNLQTQFYVF
jgi:hypothetical protein